MKRAPAFTVLEVLVVVMVIGILVLLSLPVIGKLRARAQRVQCTANLKSLHVATQLYMQEHHQWPQIRLSAQSDEGWESFAKGWLAAIAPYGPSAKTWICPTRQNHIGNPDFTQSGHERIDYIPTPFDDKPTTPHDIGTPNTSGKTVPVPWFSEAEDVHGNGNLVIFADGSVTDLKTIAGKTSSTAK